MNHRKSARPNCLPRMTAEPAWRTIQRLAQDNVELVEEVKQLRAALRLSREVTVRKGNWELHS